MPDLENIAATVAAAEAQVSNLRPGCEKRIIWAGAPAVKTPIALVYVHGFSASPEELRPLPDLVANALGANIHYTRLTGHGQDSAAMGQAKLMDWQHDVNEAIEIAQTIGDAVVIMGCSTGCTLATLALANGAQARGVIYVSPNFGLRNRAAQFVMDMPGVKHWGHIVAGQTRSFTPFSAAHTAYWTNVYPTKAVYPMADAVRAVRKADLSQIATPALFAYNVADQVVHPKDTQRVVARWGGPTEVVLLEQGPADDLMGHVMAGDVFSPGQTAPLAARISAWLKSF